MMHLLASSLAFNVGSRLPAFRLASSAVSPASIDVPSPAIPLSVDIPVDIPVAVSSNEWVGAAWVAARARSMMLPSRAASIKTCFGRSDGVGFGAFWGRGGGDDCVVAWPPPPACDAAGGVGLGPFDGLDGSGVLFCLSVYGVGGDVA